MFYILFSTLVKQVNRTKNISNLEYETTQTCTSKKKKNYIYIYIYSFVEIHAQTNSTILLTNITSPTTIIPISLSADFHSENMEVKHPKNITPQILSQYVIYLNEETNEVIAVFFLIIKHVHSCLKTSCSDTMLNY